MRIAEWVLADNCIHVYIRMTLGCSIIFNKILMQSYCFNVRTLSILPQLDSIYGCYI